MGIDSSSSTVDAISDLLTVPTVLTRAFPTSVSNDRENRSTVLMVTDAKALLVTPESEARTTPEKNSGRTQVGYSSGEGPPEEEVPSEDGPPEEEVRTHQHMIRLRLAGAWHPLADGRDGKGPPNQHADALRPLAGGGGGEILSAPRAGALPPLAGCCDNGDGVKPLPLAPLALGGAGGGGKGTLRVSAGIGA